MKSKKKTVLGLLLASGIAASVVYAGVDDLRTPAEFFSGHTHGIEGTSGGPEHSGGLDRRGCHNGSVPYHCH